MIHHQSSLNVALFAEVNFSCAADRESILRREPQSEAGGSA